MPGTVSRSSRRAAALTGRRRAAARDRRRNDLVRPDGGAADRRRARSRRLQLPRQAAALGPLLQVPRPRRSAAQGRAAARHAGRRRWPTLESGHRAVVPGSTSKSELVRRITSTDPKVMMPAPDSHLALDEVEKATLIRWIEQGAEWKPHWAFIPPVDAGRAGGADERLGARRDRSLRARARSRRRAGRRRPRRRARPGCAGCRFDLTGLPPTPAEIDAFLADARPTPTSASSIACWRRPPTASAWPPTGSTSPATPTRTATRTTACARCGRGATG